MPPTAIGAGEQCILAVRELSRIHSAHINQDVEVHYRWHALHGRKVRQLYAERRSGRDVVIVEAEPGVAIVLAAWMLDPAICAAMSLGAPTVDIAGLTDLDRLLRPSDSDEHAPMNPRPPRRFIMQSPLRPVVHGQPPRQLAMSLDRPVLNGMTPADRNTAVGVLPACLMEAAGMDTREIGDDER